MRLFSALYKSRDPFAMFTDVLDCASPRQMDEDGCLLLHGGEDISPSIYGQRPNSKTWAPFKPSKRDRTEMAFVERAVALGIPIIGICRGAQLLCALSGGKLVQHVDGHTWGKHDLVDETGFITLTNSVHHQMMDPRGTNHKIIAWSPKLSDKYLGENEEELDIPIEPELVYFPDIKAIGIQGHPEYLTPEVPFVQYCKEQVVRHVLL